MNLLLLFLHKIFGNRFSQIFLYTLFKIILRLRGIGTGAGIHSSGEYTLVRLLNKKTLKTNKPLIIFDVGANKGDFTEMLIKKLKCDYIIHCFEPSSVNVQSLERMFNSYSNVVINKIGVGETSGKANLYYNYEGSSLASLTQRDLRHHNITFDKTETIDIISIDDYCKLNGIDNISLLKMDIEGHEFQAIKGGLNLISNNRIAIISFEFGGTAVDTRIFFRDFYNFFLNHNMTIYRITPSGYLDKVNKYKEDNEQFSTTNYVAIHNSLKF